MAAFILKTGWEAARDTLDPLLGRPMDPELAADIDRIVLGHDHILGIHDLVYHDYGPGRAMMSSTPRSQRTEIFWSSMTLSTISSGN